MDKRIENAKEHQDVAHSNKWCCSISFNPYNFTGFNTMCQFKQGEKETKQMSRVNVLSLFYYLLGPVSWTGIREFLKLEIFL